MTASTICQNCGALKADHMDYGRPKLVCPTDDAKTFAPVTPASRIAQLNDLARTAMGVASRVVQTAGVCALSPGTQSRIRESVEKFNTFTKDNDPYGERDFGSVTVEGVKVFWKIDYFNRALDAHSEDPADPRQTVRVLTIMLAEEY